MSKSISYLLRHGAIKEGVPIRNDGKMLINDLLSWLNRKGISLSYNDIIDIVHDDQKSRYSIDNDLIWATQGHSMNLDVQMKKWNGDSQLVHVSYIDHYDSILEQGLKSMSRKHIHMIDPNPLKGGWDLVRKNANMYVIINAQVAMDDGIVFMEADNGVILTEGTLPVDYLFLVKAPRNTGCYGFIVQSTSGKTLLVRTPSGRYGFPKGKKHKVEHSLCCALRELYEETGLTVSQLTIQPNTYEEINDRGNCPTVYFYAIVDGEPEVTCLDKDEGLTCHWMSKEQINKLSETEFYGRRRKLLF